MTRLCEGRVAIVTGAGRGLGREHALMLAAHGARLLVNDLGAHVDGSGRDASFAAQTVADIKKAGGMTGTPVMGRIINTTSTSGIYGNVGQTNYGAAKAGIAARKCRRWPIRSRPAG